MEYHITLVVSHVVQTISHKGVLFEVNNTKRDYDYCYYYYYANNEILFEAKSNGRRFLVQPNIWIASSSIGVVYYLLNTYLRCKNIR